MKESIATCTKAVLVVGLLGALVACGGGGSSAPVVTPTPPAPQLSADQSVFESLNLTSPGGAYSLSWSFASNTVAPVKGTDYFLSSSAQLAASPLTSGAQSSSNAAWVDMTHTPLGIPVNMPVTRYLINGKITLPAVPAKTIVSYPSGSTGIQVDTLAVDGLTKVVSQLRSGYSKVNLTGLIKAAPADFSSYFYALFNDPAGLLSTTASWGTGDSYVKYTATNLVDEYEVFDSGTPATYGTTPTPTATNTNIAALMTAGGIASSSDAVTYSMGNGTVSVINGVNTYVATAPRPNQGTTQYRTYYELNGNVYTGALVKAGTVLAGSHYTPSTGTPVWMNYQIRLNQSASNNLKASLTF